ncbi:hypothetical protein QEJ31_11700 [Pigmentibacter sp. JX0631]|uniref:hypothetical protein n=1 Tax=Pigmentibacter sp. JX0631 TaxID=2976982 RepID=UPI00246965F9|nr:hypothetical protein [Pigmentibacter sp. JX0631]WGL59185.1 hypothetical protein QEJ31_11700 [Pigmentibacter sp. JX0631]
MKITKILSIFSLLTINSANATTVLQTLNCVVFQRFGYVSGDKFYFNIKENKSTNPATVEIASLLIPTTGIAKNVVIELVDQDDTKAYFAYNEISATYDKISKTASFTKSLDNGLNQVYAYCAK